MFKVIFSMLAVVLAISFTSCEKEVTEVTETANLEWIKELNSSQFQSLVAAAKQKDPSLFEVPNKSSSKFCFQCFDWEYIYMKYDYCDTFANPDMYPDDSPEYQSIMADCMSGSE